MFTWCQGLVLKINQKITDHWINTEGLWRCEALALGADQRAQRSFYSLWSEGIYSCRRSPSSVSIRKGLVGEETRTQKSEVLSHEQRTRVTVEQRFERAPKEKGRTSNFPRLLVFDESVLPVSLTRFSLVIQEQSEWFDQPLQEKKTTLIKIMAFNWTIPVLII